MSGLFGGAPKMESPPPAPDPDEEGPLAKEARKRRLQKRQGASGRTSTILTNMGSSGGDYAGGTMG